jgi:hypothetical protein
MRTRTHTHAQARPHVHRPDGSSEHDIVLAADESSSVSAQLVGSVIQLVHTRMREVDQRIAATLSGASSQPPPVTPSTPPKATPETRDEPEKRSGWRGVFDRIRGSV